MFYHTSRNDHPAADLGADAVIAQRDAQAGPVPPREGSGEIFLLRQDIERLLMISEALWGILKEKHGYADEELRRRVEEIDLRDGRLDGRLPPSPPMECPHCGYTIRRRRALCLYCGKPVGSEPFAR